MEYQDLQEQQKIIRRKMRLKIIDDATRLKQLADDFAECATNIQGQGYMNFVRCREDFLCEIDRMSENYCALVWPESEVLKS